MNTIRGRSEQGYEKSTPKSGRSARMLGEYLAGKLLPRHSQLNHHPLLSFINDHEVSREEEADVFVKVGARDGLAPRTNSKHGFDDAEERTRSRDPVLRDRKLPNT